MWLLIHAGRVWEGFLNPRLRAYLFLSFWLLIHAVFTGESVEQGTSL